MAEILAFSKELEQADTDLTEMSEFKLIIEIYKFWNSAMYTCVVYLCPRLPSTPVNLQNLYKSQTRTERIRDGPDEFQ